MRCSRLPLMLFLFCIFAFSAFGPVYGQCPDTGGLELLNSNATTDSGNDLQVRVRAGGGTWVAVWASSEAVGGSGTDFDILTARSVDAGGNWSSPAVLNSTGLADTGSDINPRVATDGLGNWIAAWVSTDTLGDTVGTDFDLLYAVSVDDGVSWSPAAALNSGATSDAGSDVNVELASDGQGTWLAVWTGPVPVGSTDVLLSISTNDGTSWSAQTPIVSTVFGNTAIDSVPQIASDGADTWVVTWHSTETLGGTLGTDRDILFTRSTDDGVLWSAPAPLNSTAATDSGNDQNTTVATDGAGNWVVAWQSTDTLPRRIGTDFDIVYSRSLNDGVTWSAPGPLNTNAGTDTGFDVNVRLSADGLGNWLAVWTSNEVVGGAAGTDQDPLTSLSTDAGGSWSAPSALAPNAATDSAADGLTSLDADGLGNWVVTWDTDEDVSSSGTDDDLVQMTFTISADDCDANGVPDECDPDEDGDGLINDCDDDDDADGVPDINDPAVLNPDFCGDSDGDTCDDCSIGTDDLGPLSDQLPNNDGLDTDGDGLCDAGDNDDDNDGVDDMFDDADLDPTVCRDLDADGCDDCAVGTDGLGPLVDADPANDGLDTDSDGLCNLGDTDDDNDGVVDPVDPSDLDPDVCGDSDSDFCDDCAVGTDDFGPMPDNLPNNDGADADGDGQCDLGDPCPVDNPDDTDGDGVCESSDICAGGDDGLDADGDGVPDFCDVCAKGNDNLDGDGDGVPDFCDACPGGDDAVDGDGDGQPDACDPCPADNPNDDDGDGICNSVDICAGGDDLVDSDGDGVPNFCDSCAGGDDSLDADGDGVADFCDACPGFDDSIDADGDGAPDGCDICAGGDDGVDPDGDGVPSDCDPCPADNPDDSDLDGVCDADDVCPGGNDNVDSDSDGTADFCDLCPGFDDTIDLDGDGVPDGCDVCAGGNDGLDSDGDGVPNSCDICPGGDDSQESDGDGVPDACDDCPGGDDTLDLDGDNVPDDCDICPGGNDNSDADGDGVPNFCDACPGFDDSVDSDLDSVPDGCDACPGGNDNNDGDGDGVPDACDICAVGDDTIDVDGDSVPDACDLCPGGDDALDGDGDTIPDACDICALGDDTIDSDSDTVPDACDVCAGGNDTIDVDGDGVPLACDICEGADDALDADGDSVPDGCDACPGGDDNADGDGDGVADACDACPLDNPDDSDGDGSCDADDVCPGGDDNVDGDGDGVADFCDPCPVDNPDDSDGDGSCDADDICPGGDDNADADLDTVPNFCDICPGGDDFVDVDGDTVPDTCDPCPVDSPDDTDGDGVCESDDVCPGGDDNADSDGDGVADFCDSCPGFDDAIDADGDTVADACDVCPGFDDLLDTDFDGTPDDCDACPTDLSTDVGPCSDVLIRMIVRHERSDFDTTTDLQLPASDPAQLEGGCFVLEMWAIDVSPQANGLACVFTDVDFGDLVCPLVATAIDFDGPFNQFTTGTITNVPADAANIDELGGCTLTPSVGVGHWARVAVIEFDGPAVGPCATSATQAAADTDTALFNVGLTSAVDISGVSDVLVDDLGVIYNLDAQVSGDTTIGPGDFSFFAQCWLAVSPLDFCEDRDFDCDGVIGPGDLSFFATGWMLSVDDPAIIVPDCQLHCTTSPAGGPDDGSRPQLPWATVEEIESFGLPVPPADWPGWDLDPDRDEKPRKNPERNRDRKYREKP